LSTHALRTSDPPPALRLLRALDLIVLAAALAVFALAGLPLAAYAVAAIVWVAQRALGQALQRRAAASEDPKAVVGLIAGGSMARAWLMALAVLATGLVAGERAGLAAALLIVVLFTTYFISRLIGRGVSG
jgi:hypothetical protein